MQKIDAKTRAIIVDDERRGRESLALLLNNRCPFVEIVAEADSALMATEAIHANKPDIVFLDIDMPGGSGFEVLKAFETIHFDVIFVTAHDHYALKAFKFSAVDYLLKPVVSSELENAVAKSIRNRLNKTQQFHHLMRQVQNPRPNKLTLPTQDGYLFIEIQEIIWCRAESNYTKFFLQNGSWVMVSKTLKYYEELLSDCDFYRVHNSNLVNLRHCKEYRNSEDTIIMNDNSKVRVAPRRKPELLKQLGDLSH